MRLGSLRTALSLGAGSVLVASGALAGMVLCGSSSTAAGPKLSDSCKVFTVNAGTVKVAGCSSNKEAGEKAVETNGSGTGTLMPRPFGFFITYKPPYEGGTTSAPASTGALISLSPANPDERETKTCPKGTTESNLTGSIGSDTTDPPGSADNDVNGAVTAEICQSATGGGWALEPGTTLKFFEGVPGGA